MKGDIITIKPEYFHTSEAIVQFLEHKMTASDKYVVCIAGESGSGKSVTAVTLSREFDKKNIGNLILHMDDYFILPPEKNHQNRLKSLKNVGKHEVHLDILQKNLDDFKEKKNTIHKPLVDYQKNTIQEEEVDVSGCRVLIVEGTYVASLKHYDTLIFMERTYKETYDNRKERNRERSSDFIERVLEIEHDIIAAYKPFCHIMIDKNYNLVIHNPENIKS